MIVASRRGCGPGALPLALAVLVAAAPAFASPGGRVREAGPPEPDDGVAATWSSAYRVDYVLHFLVGFQVGFVVHVGAEASGLEAPLAATVAQAVTAVLGLSKEAWDAVAVGGSGWDWLDLGLAAAGCLLGSALAAAFSP